MRPTAEQILSFLDKANEIRDIHEVLPSDDPEAANKAIVEVFYERFFPLSEHSSNQAYSEHIIQKAMLAMAELDIHQDLRLVEIPVADTFDPLGLFWLVKFERKSHEDPWSVIGVYK